MPKTMWDIFICHASEDKEAIARPLANALKQAGLDVWYDEFTLTLGDSLRRKIDYGLGPVTLWSSHPEPAFFCERMAPA
jgi:TIR domain